MAHLPQDQLPSEFDVVVDGTGLVQSVLAAALARAGKTVLHLDRNAYYGELWGSLMHREMQEWMTEYRSRDEETTPQTSEPSDTPPAYLPCEGESVLEIDRTHIPASITNLVETVHTVPEDDNSSTRGRAEYGGDVKSEGDGDGGATNEGDIGDGATGEGDIGDGATGEGDTCVGATGESDTGVGATGEGDIGDGATGEGDTGVGATGEGDIGDGATGESDIGDGATSEGTEAGNGNNMTEPSATTPLSSKVTWQSLEPQWRRFNFDLLPKFIFCRGAMVDLITESSCSRYIEFRAVGGIFNYNNGQIEQVPCSRSDVFSSKAVTMMEKRKMMKFLTFCADFQQHPEEYKDVATLPYVEYLRQRQLTPNLVQYILHSIAMVTDTTTTLEGLQATQVFINSLGRYGNAPFLFPIFGGGELPQAFCRLCAVYGGVYCLHRHVTSIITSAPDNTISSIVCSSGQKIKCSSVVLSAAYLTKTVEFKDALKTTRLSRAMLVTDSPLEGTDGKLSLVTLPPGSLGEAQTVAIRVIQLDHLSNSCPAGTFMVQMQCSSVRETAQEDLQPAARALFNIENDRGSNSSGPRLLWSLYYNVELHSINQSQTSTLECPRGLYVTSEPDTTIGYERAASEARELFSRICPGEDFLPHPPNPEDIIFEDSTNNHDDEAAGTKVNAPNNQALPTNTETPPTTSEAPPINDTPGNTGTYIANK